MNQSQLTPIGGDKRSHNLQSIVQNSTPAPLPEHQLHKLYNSIRLLRTDAGPNVTLYASGKSVRGSTGFRSVRASHGVSLGTFYYEVFWHPTPALPGQSSSANTASGADSLDSIQIPQIVPVVNSLLYPNHNNQVPTEAMVRIDNIPGAARLTTDPNVIHAQSPHLRVGFSKVGVDTAFPVGHDELSFAYRDTNGSKVCNSISESYGHAFAPGDVIGCLIHIPPTANTLDMNTLVEKSTKAKPNSARLHPGVYSGNNYVNNPNPTYPYQEQSVLLDVSDNIYRHQWNISHLQPKTNSFIEFFKNGVSQGIAFTDLPVDTFYPQISLFQHATATCNFGPDFAFPPVKYCSTQHVSVPTTISDTLSPTTIFQKIITIDAQYRVLYTPYMLHFTSRSKSSVGRALRLAAAAAARKRTPHVPRKPKTPHPPPSPLPDPTTVELTTHPQAPPSTPAPIEPIPPSTSTTTDLPPVSTAPIPPVKPKRRFEPRQNARDKFQLTEKKRLALRTSVDMAPVIPHEQSLQSILALCDVLKHPDHSLNSQLNILKPVLFSRTEYSRLFPFPSLTTTAFSLQIAPYFHFELALLESSVFYRFCAAFQQRFGAALTFPSHITTRYAPPPTKIVERVRLNSIPLLRTNYRYHDSYDDLIIPIPPTNNQLLYYPDTPVVNSARGNREHTLATNMNPHNIARPEYIHRVLIDPNTIYHLSQRFSNLSELTQQHQAYINQHLPAPQHFASLSQQQLDQIPPMPELLALGSRLSQQYTRFCRESRRARVRSVLHQFLTARASFLMAGNIEEILASEKEATVFFVKQQLRQLHAEHHCRNNSQPGSDDAGDGMDLLDHTSTKPQPPSLKAFAAERNQLLRRRLSSSLHALSTSVQRFYQLMTGLVLKQSTIYQLIVNLHQYPHSRVASSQPVSLHSSSPPQHSLGVRKKALTQPKSTQTPTTAKSIARVAKKMAPLKEMSDA